MKNKAPNAMSSIHKFGVHVFLIILCIPFLLPLVWMLSTSLKTKDQIFLQAGKDSGKITINKIIPNPVAFNNYPEALKTVPFAKYVRNTLFICIYRVLGAVLSSALVAYGFARLKFWGRDALFFAMIATMALPAQVTMIPVFIIFKTLGWYDTFLPIIIPAYLGSAFFIFLLRQFFYTIPEELSEAARIDGAGELRIFWQIMMPLARPALATVALFTFLGSWNDMFSPLIYINNQAKYPLAYGLQQFLSSYSGEWGQLMAGSAIFTIPIIILFFFTQKTFIQGISTTGGKS